MSTKLVILIIIQKYNRQNMEYKYKRSISRQWVTHTRIAKADNGLNIQRYHKQNLVYTYKNSISRIWVTHTKVALAEYE